MGFSAYFEEEDSTSLALVGQQCPWNEFHLMIFFLPLLGSLLGENSKLYLFELLWPHPGIPLSFRKIISAHFCLQKLNPARALWGKSWNGVRSCYMEFSIQQEKSLYTQINGIKSAIYRSRFESSWLWKFSAGEKCTFCSFCVEHSFSMHSNLQEETAVFFWISP